MILAKTVKGYGMGEAGEGQNITHQQKKMGENVLRAFRDRFGIGTCPTSKIAEVPFLPLQRGQPRAGLPAGAARGARRALPVRRQQSTETLPVPELSAFDAQLKPTGEPHDLHDDGVRPDPDHAVAGQADRQAGGADRAGRVAHLRHGGPVPPVRDLVPGRAALPARGREPAHVLQGGQVRPDAAGGHQRGRRHVVLDRRGHQLLGVRHAR